MDEKSEKSSSKRHFVGDAKDVKTTVSDKSYEGLSKEAQDMEISKSELVRHIIYGYQLKKESSQPKEE